MKSIKSVLSPVVKYVSVSAISQAFFGKQRGWFNNKLCERTINGVKYHFSSSECLTLSDALSDLSEKLSLAAEELKLTAKQMDRATGRFYTKTNPFNHPLFFQWLSLLPQNVAVVEPFAGANDIPIMLREIGFNPVWKCFDINPPIDNNGFYVTKRNSMENLPKGTIFITNPPFLARNSAKKSHYPYPATIFPNTYLHCLSQMLERGKYIAVILPESFISCRLFKERLYGVISLNFKVFADTDYPVCLAMFVPQKQEDYPIYNGDVLLGYFSELAQFNATDNTKGDWVFNSPNGSIGIKCVDGNEADISFCRGETIHPSKIKVSSRSITRVQGLPEDIDRDSFIRIANSLLTEYRNRTKDIFLTSFKGLRSDKHYRRRIDFGTLRYIMNEALARLKQCPSRMI